MMISIPVAVHIPRFKMQLDLFWYNHKKVYGNDAYNKAKAIIIKYNNIGDVPIEKLEWDIDIPHKMCDSVHNVLDVSNNSEYKPLNIQIGLQQIIDEFDDEQIIELLDCDLFHMKKHQDIDIKDDELFVCDLYEKWHLLSLTENKYIIEPYFENNGKYYIGGFVPIVGKVKTFKKILREWIEVHKHILSLDYDFKLKWWAGMFALQVTCEKNKINMIANDTCYIPALNEINDNHYICHYSVDKIFDKHKFPDLDFSKFKDNIFYNNILDYMICKNTV